MPTVPIPDATDGFNRLYNNPINRKVKKGIAGIKMVYVKFIICNLSNYYTSVINPSIICLIDYQNLLVFHLTNVFDIDILELSVYINNDCNSHGCLTGCNGNDKYGVKMTMQIIRE